jgi:HemX protein
MATETLVHVLRIALPFLYAGLVTVYGLAFFRPQASAEWLGRPFMIAVLALHLLYLGLRTVQLDHPPITTLFETMTLLSVSITIAYLYLEFRTNARNTGFFILILAFVFQTISSVFIRDNTILPEYLHSKVLGFHVSTAMLGTTGFSLAAVYGALYLMLYHEIKSSRFGVIYSRLPNLETLETMSHGAVVFGFVTLSVAMTIGLFWLPRVFHDFSFLDPKLVGTIAAWVLYAAGLIAKRRLGWQGRKTMILAIVGFAVVLLSMLVINISFSTFHAFH